MNLPGLPTSARRIRARADREGWRFEEQSTSGRPARAYLVDDLPEATRAELARREAARVEVTRPDAALQHRAREVAEQTARERALAALGKLGDDALAEVSAKLWVLDALAQFERTSGLTSGKAQRAFAELYNEGEIDAPDDVRQLVGSVGARTLRRWDRARQEGGPAALAPAYGARSAREYSSAITEDNEIGRYVLGLLYEKGRLVTAATMRRGALALYAAGEIEARPPSERTFQRFLTFLERERPAVWNHLVSPHKARGVVMPAFGSASDALTRPNERWELDSTLADVLLTEVDPGTGEDRAVRYHLLACVDVYTRRTLFLISRRSRSVSIAALLRKCLLAWGVPEAVKMDNGKDYTSRHLEGALAALEVRRELCPPYTPTAKPHVERVIGTFQRDWLTLVDGYVGASVKQRKAVEARKAPTAAGEAPMQLGQVHMSPVELQGLADDWCLTTYLHGTHAGLDGRTPFEVARASTAPVNRIRSERALDVLLARPAGSRGGRMTVQKKGIRYLPGPLSGSRRAFYFTDPELVAGDWIGREVQCREDVSDLGRLYVFDPASGDFVCVAECPQLTGTSLAEAAALANAAYREKRAAIMAEAKDAAKEHRASTVLGHVRAQARGERKVVGQIEPHVENETSALEGARRAVRALENRGKAAPPTPEVPAEDWAEAERLEAEAEARRQREADELAAAARAASEAEGGADGAPAPPPAEAVLHTLSTSTTRRLYRDDQARYEDVLDRLVRGEAVSQADLDFKDHYETGGLSTGTNGR